MHQRLRLPFVIIIFFLLLTGLTLFLPKINSQLLRTQVNLTTPLSGLIRRNLFAVGSNTITATVRLNDGTSQTATTNVEVTTALSSSSKPLSSPPPTLSPLPSTEPNRTHQQALSDLGPTCGNGLLESGETCDFGDNPQNLSNCSNTCQLRSSECNFYVGRAPARPGDVLTFSSPCFTSNNGSIAIISINGKDGAPSFISPSINPNRQEGNVPGVFRRNIPRNIEGGGTRGFYLLKNGAPSGSVAVNIHPNLTLPETRLSGTSNWDVTLATPEYSTTGNHPETYLVQLPPQLPPNTSQSGDTITFFTLLASSCPNTFTPNDTNQQAGSSSIPYTGQRNIRLTKAHVETTNFSSQICIYLETTGSPAFQLQTQAPLFERN